MRPTRKTAEQVARILKAHSAGARVVDLCLEHGIAETTFYKWKAKYGGMTESEVLQLEELERETRRPKRKYPPLPRWLLRV